MKVWLNKTLNGAAPSDEHSAKVLKRFPVGTMFEVDIVTRNVRSGSWHRRYWKLISMLAENVERVELEPGASPMEIKGPEDMHVAVKYLTGLFDSFAIGGGGVVRLIRSTAFDKMTPEEWAPYYERVLQVVHAKILPGVDLYEVRDELARMAS